MCLPVSLLRVAIELTEWPYENSQTEKVRTSDGSRGNVVPLEALSRYDFRELRAYLGNVSLQGKG